jgi:large subunit ribosomal protein L23
MDLSVYEVIRRPRVTSKAYSRNKDLKQLVLDVHTKATKPMIREALHRLFNVEASSIRVALVKGKSRRSGGRYACKDAMRKKAYVTLKSGNAAELMEGGASEAARGAK